ncbi:DUF1236 domain-containing protein [Microvirga massiliensis]|uniref:DUF1236 domain-containing protein n=1 Tax=Microvirga massiliensis TaxID=1033741 RepID=UPI00062BE24B|nr:DUF1236 domain-containing protein [Microvirga massiliensis]
MRKSLLTITCLAAFAMPFAASAQSEAGAAAGATTGAIGGAVVGGPVGAVVGGAAGAIIGGLTADQSRQVRQYVIQQERPSVRVQEQVVVGQPLPRTVELYELPPDVGVQTEYRYGVVNNQRVIVEPGTRRVVEVIR